MMCVPTQHLIGLVLCLSAASSFAYTLHRRDSWPDSQQLEDALKIIQERRRLIEENDEPLRYAGLDLNDLEGEEEEDDDFDFRRENDDPWSERELLTPETLEYLRDTVYRENPDSQSEADMDEISNILEDEDEKRIPPEMHKKEYDPSADKKSISGGEIDQNNKEKITEEEIKDIMENEAVDAMEDSMTKGELDEENNEADTTNNAAVTNEELENVLSDDEQEEEGEIFPNMIAKEVDLNKETYGGDFPTPSGTIKRKRSGYPIFLDDELEDDEENVGDDMTEFQGSNDSGKAREYIKQFLALEDDENNNLANALNLATLAQVDRTNHYLGEEAKYIKNAISDEEAIQELKNELKDYDEPSEVKRDPLGVQEAYEEELGQELPEEEDLSEQEEEELKEEEAETLREYMAGKLREYLMSNAANEVLPNTYEDSLGQWFKEPLNDDEEGINDEESTLNPFLRELMQKYYKEEVSKRAFIPEEYVAPEEEDDEDINDATTEELRTVLHSYVKDMTPAERLLLKEAVEEKLNELEEEEEVENEIEEEENYCPALDVLDDCQAARRDGLNLDLEALYMCNRHQMCYICGSSQGFEEVQCDLGYLEEAKRLCNHEDNPRACRTDSKRLLIDMKKEHVWIKFKHAPPQCSEKCAAEYILGLDNKRK